MKIIMIMIMIIIIIKGEQGGRFESVSHDKSVELMTRKDQRTEPVAGVTYELLEWES